MNDLVNVSNSRIKQYFDFHIGLIRDDPFSPEVMAGQRSQYGMGSGLSSKIMMIIMSLINKSL